MNPNSFQMQILRSARDNRDGYTPTNFMARSRAASLVNAGLLVRQEDGATGTYLLTTKGRALLEDA